MFRQKRPTGLVTITGWPSLSQPIGPVSRDPKADGLDVCVLATKRAAWISSLKTTSTPSPRATVLAATWMAASRFAGPSAPGSEGPRIAPVTTVGALPAHSRSSANAVSSMVSVPCVITTPAAPSAIRPAISSRSMSRSPNVIDREGRWMN
jgi:hypothetical protein